MALRRRIALALAALALAGPALAAKPPPRSAAPPARQDFSLGSAKAKVEVVEYASLSCPHCAAFNAQVFPAFKARYVDTGQVRYTLREMLTPPAEIAAAGFLLARCAGKDKYFKIVDEVFRSQPLWPDAQAIKPIFLGIARNNGLSEAQFEACLSDEKAFAALNERVRQAVEVDKVSSTPTFFVNGKRVGEGEMSLEDLDAAIAAARKRGG